MKALLSLRPSPALVVAFLALLVALSDTSWATLSQAIPRNSVGAPQIRANAVGSSEIRNQSIKRRDLALGARARRGPAGPRGATGPAGPAGAVSRLWAVVNASGSLARAAGTSSAGRVAAGQYEVIFGQDVQNCVFHANVGDPGNISNAGGSAGFATVGRRSGNVNGVRVNTRANNGVLADRPFHMIVVC